MAIVVRVAILELRSHRGLLPRALLNGQAMQRTVAMPSATNRLLIAHCPGVYFLP
jgi:hypothetical protein